MERSLKEQELDRLRREVQVLENEVSEVVIEPVQWAPAGYYFSYDVLAGLVLGLFAGTTSLLFNIIGAAFVPPPAGLTQHPLNLIRVYLTFPMRELALHVDSGLILTFGCCLYLVTGMVLGIPFQMAQSRLLPRGGLIARLLLVTPMALAVWAINYHGILSWLQPYLFGGSWIVDTIPSPVAIGTHLVFGWTMAILYPLGVFQRERKEGAQIA